MSRTLQIPKPKTKFLKVKCASCGNDQIVFSNPASKIFCLVCNHALAESGAGHIKLKANIVKEFD